MLRVLANAPGQVSWLIGFPNNTGNITAYAKVEHDRSGGIVIEACDENGNVPQDSNRFWFQLVTRFFEPDRASVERKIREAFSVIERLGVDGGRDNGGLPAGTLRGTATRDTTATNIPDLPQAGKPPQSRFNRRYKLSPAVSIGDAAYSSVDVVFYASAFTNGVPSTCYVNVFPADNRETFLTGTYYLPGKRLPVSSREGHYWATIALDILGYDVVGDDF